MILEKLKDSAEKALHDWARLQGLENPPPLVLNAPPAHIPADVSLPWPMAVGKALRRKPLDIAKESVKQLTPLPQAHENIRGPQSFH